MKLFFYTKHLSPYFLIFILLFLICIPSSFGTKNPNILIPQQQNVELKSLAIIEPTTLEFADANDSALLFDFPVVYNRKVKYWIHFFQNNGRHWFRTWLERANRFVPKIQKVLHQDHLPLDLAYIAMIESGYSSSASSTAQAVGHWQFIPSTGRRYGLTINWWLDERRDFDKSTKAAAKYLEELYRIFKSWYLAAASYNSGENLIKRLIKKHNTSDYWELSRLNALPKETEQYVPKLLAAMMISKAPGLYGFRNLEQKEPFKYQFYKVPGGTDLTNLADYLGVTKKYLKDLNPELIKGFVPNAVNHHAIRVPIGSIAKINQYLKK